MSIIVREACKEDLPRIEALWVQLIDYHHALDSRHWQRAEEGPGKFRRWMEQALADHQRVLFVAEDTGAVIGFTHGELKGGPPPMMPRLDGFVSDMIVDEAFRGKGVGTMLLTAIESWFAARGAGAVMLSAAVRNRATLAFYSRNGFEPWVTTMWKPLPNRPQGGKPGHQKKT